MHVQNEVDDLYWLRPKATAIFCRYLQLRDGSKTVQVIFSGTGLCVHSVTESTLIWMHDVGRVLSSMSGRFRHALELSANGYTQDEIAYQLRVCRKTVCRTLANGMDELTAKLIVKKILNPQSPHF